MNTISQNKIDELVPSINFVLQKHKDSKIEYATNKVIKSFNKVTKKYLEEVGDAELELATEENGKVIKDSQGRFEYSKENYKKLELKRRELKDKEYSFEPYYTSSVPEELSLIIIEELMGYIIDPEYKKGVIKE